MALIAKVTVHALVDGERRAYEPGDELPELHPHDVAQLLASDSIEDSEAAAADARSAAKEAGRSMAAFSAERKAVQAAEQSITPPAKKKAN